MKNKKLDIQKIRIPFDFYNIEIKQSLVRENKYIGEDYVSLYNGLSTVGIFHKRNSNILDFNVFTTIKDLK